MTRVSIVIPTKNAGCEFSSTLEKIKMQDIDVDLEIIAIDSGSIDNTIEICEKFGVKVIKIQPEQFNHGGTRNLGISVASGDYVVLLVQDAVPLNNAWLRYMIEDLKKDEKIAGVYCKQIPKDNCNIFTKYALENWITYKDTRIEQYINDIDEYRNLSPIEKQIKVTFDNVSSCIRKSVWEKNKFSEINFGEDIDWSKRVIEAGYKIVYEPRSAVIHSHNRSIWYETKRTYVCHKTLKKLFGMQLVPSVTHLVRNLGADIKLRFNIVYDNKKSLKSHMTWYYKAILLSIGMQIGMYLGGKSDNFKSNFTKKIDKILSRGV